MPAYVVYLDQVMLGNLVMNYAILWSTARFGRINIAKWRLFAGAGLGSLYTLALFLPRWNSLLTVSCKFTVSVLMVFIAFAPLRLKRFFQVLAYFYLSSFILGGVVLGCMYFLRSGNSFFNSGLGSPSKEYFGYGIALALVVAWIMGKIFELARKKAFQDTCKASLLVRLWGSSVELEALVDTGNSLTDPLSQHPVIIVEYKAIKELLPPPIQNLFDKDNLSDFALLHDTLSGNKWSERFRLIPFQSLGRSDGLLLGFRPDEIITGADDRKKLVRKVVVGIYPGRLDANDSYHALLHPLIMDEHAA
ncbi:sigma-E processing peptidase SpoIIGA [Desulfofarcimen acetoxidans DSM 771]|uniref:Sporulation sigma-E factor-processing peptidase n=1 Tax=Desulfofarcimen acetoxidans (strain ATCC 49208 / DSM 771 / KCTC 5769 / VKM B-1644 / 5575) TaxID=485916 RepID=C8W483_DESAS|nr:sigma-E processing peptidase SpoIIGA [Desulfofarcimen acetoxidans]ACV61951.1 sigma-E processing peptidase SpoIIGA [Desulfofarcimen acetoxidans DSM 771]